MRLYVRNKTKYDPPNAGKPLVFVEFPDPRKFTIGQVKEEFKKKARAAKVDSLYIPQDDGSYKVLADDRTIGYYNIQDKTILETTSNPFWAAAIYYRLREVETNAAKEPVDARATRGLEQSAIQKYMALGILFNGNNPEQQQPPYFEELDQLFEHLTTAGKKPVHMSQITLDTLQALKDEFLQNDVHENDPIGCFVCRQAVKLGFISETDVDEIRSGEDRDENVGQTGRRLGGGRGVQRTNPGADNRGGRGRGKGGNSDNNGGKKPNGRGRGGRRVARQERMCEDCEENVATQFCADCQPPIVLCGNCTVVLHRGATRRNHHLQDVSDAPPLVRDHSYTPKAYRAPFAMLVAFHRASNEVPSKMSLSADQLKPRAQPLTDTDLENKKGGKWFGGFDSLENTLIKNDLVQKEAAGTPKYSLMERGQPLAARCSEFDYAVQNLTQAASVPTIPVMAARPVFRNRRVCLLVDSEEPLRERFVRVARQRGLSARTRKLPVGDFLWVLLPPGVNPDIARDMPEQELVLPMIVERKTWDDLWSSLKTPRFASQVNRMKNCGLQNLFYLMEGSPKDLRGHPGVEVETFLQNKVDALLLEDQFLVNRTGSWIKSVEWLCHLTNMGVEVLQAEVSPNLMTYSEFAKAGKAKKHLVAINEDTTTAPVTSTMWSASEFADIVRSHSNGGKQLHDLPASPRTSNHLKKKRSLIIVQGLTQYNKQCHSLLDKTLANLLKNSQQTPEACVQSHLEGVTDQLIHQDVLQWHILWLQVFKGVIVRRTETEEESNEILSKFYSNPAAEETVLPYYKAVPAQVQEPRPPQDDVVFASDSQEEEAMIRQALRASEYEENDPLLEDAKNSLTMETANRIRRPGEIATHQPLERTIHTTCDVSADSSYSLDVMSEEDQLRLALNLSKAECEATSSQSGSSLNLDKTAAQMLVGSKMPARKTMLHTPPRTKSRARSSLPTETIVHNEKKSFRRDSDLEAALQESLEDVKKEPSLNRLRQEIKHNEHNGDSELERALELSRMEYKSSRNADRIYYLGGTGKQSMIKSKGCDITASSQHGREDDLAKALRLSKVESSDSTNIAKALEQNQVDNLHACEMTRVRENSVIMLSQEHDRKAPDDNRSQDEDMEEALELSRMEHEWSKESLPSVGTEGTSVSINGKQCRERPELSEDKDLMKAMALSRITYEQVTEGNGKDSFDKTEETCLMADEEQVIKVLECSRSDILTEALEVNQLECGQSKDILSVRSVNKTVESHVMTNNKLHGKDAECSRDNDLEKALELSRIEYEQTQDCDGDATRDDSDVIIVEENIGDELERDTCLSAARLKERKNTLSPRKSSFLIDTGDDVVPSSVVSEWDQQSQDEGEMYEALNPVLSSGSSKNCAISIDSQDLGDDILEAQEVQLDELAEANRKHVSSKEEDSTVDDFAYALQLQEELNKERRVSDSNNNEVSLQTTVTAGSEITEQLSAYRQSQKNKHSSFYGKKDKSAPGLDFRKNVTAYVSGRPVKVGIASPNSRPGHSLKGHKPEMSVGEKRSPVFHSARTLGGHQDEIHTIRDEVSSSSTVSSPSFCTEISSKRSQLFPPRASSSPRPSSSPSKSFVRTDGITRPYLPSAIASPSPSVSEPRTSDMSSMSCLTDSDKMLGPTCGACREKGHNKNSKKCPQYFSAENVQKREEQSRKRKAKREEDEQEFQDRLGALAAQRLSIEDQSRALGDQLDQLRRQSQNMANTQKMVEDAIKRRRKR